MSGPRRNLQNSGSTRASHTNFARRYTHANTARTTLFKSIITLLRTHTIFFSPPDSTTSPLTLVTQTLYPIHLAMASVRNPSLVRARHPLYAPS